MTETQALLADLERAECGSRELDERICAFTDWETHENAYGYTVWVGAGGVFKNRPPNFSESIDAALTLFEEAVRADALYAAVRKTPLTICGAERFPLILVGLWLTSLRARPTAAGEADNE